MSAIICNNTNNTYAILLYFLVMVSASWISVFILCSLGLLQCKTFYSANKIEIHLICFFLSILYVTYAYRFVERRAGVESFVQVQFRNLGHSIIYCIHLYGQTIGRIKSLEQNNNAV